MSAQSYGLVADIFGRPVFEWVKRREDEKIAEWIEYNERQEIKASRARLRAERKASRGVAA
jgi:hypothetical protein